MLALILLPELGAEQRIVQLNNGVSMPKLAFAANAWSAPTCHNATALALSAGFRFVWSSALVGEDCQRAQHAAIAASGIPRSELFIAGTVDTQDCTGAAGCKAATARGVAEQYDRLGKPLDMIMLDYPSSDGCDGITGQWQALQEAYAGEKQLRSIAVSNFDKADIECASRPGQVVPAANQLPFHVGSTGGEPAPYNLERGIQVQAYSPLGSGSVLSDPTLQKIGAAHGKTTAQAALRYVLQKNVTIATQSTSAAHLAEDLGVFDWSLTPTEMAELDKERDMRGR